MKIWGGTVKSYVINLFKYIPIFSQKFPVCVTFVGYFSPAVPAPLSAPFLTQPQHDQFQRLMFCMLWCCPVLSSCRRTRCLSHHIAIICTGMQLLHLPTHLQQAAFCILKHFCRCMLSASIYFAPAVIHSHFLMPILQS